MQTTTRAIHGEPAYTRVKREPTRLLSLYNRYTDLGGRGEGMGMGTGDGVRACLPCERRRQGRRRCVCVS